MGVAAFCGAFATAAATSFVDTCDTPPTLSDRQAPGVYYTVRFSHAGFTSGAFMGDNRLKLSLSEADGASNRPGSFSSAFCNTQGRKIDTPGAIFASIEMFISSDFMSDPNRVGGHWGTAIDATDTITAYPIIAFADGGFQLWNGTAFEGVGLPTGFVADSFVEMSIKLDAMTDMFTFMLNGETVKTTGANGSVSLSNIIIQGINTTAGIDRDIYFDNLKTMTSPAPVPAALPLLLTGLAAFGLLARRKSA